MQSPTFMELVGRDVQRICAALGTRTYWETPRDGYLTTLVNSSQLTQLGLDGLNEGDLRIFDRVALTSSLSRMRFVADFVEQVTDRLHTANLNGNVAIENQYRRILTTLFDAQPSALTQTDLVS